MPKQSVGSDWKVSGRLLNVYVHSDAFSREVIFKNLRFFFGHPLDLLDALGKYKSRLSYAFVFLNYYYVSKFEAEQIYSF